MASSNGPESTCGAEPDPPEGTCGAEISGNILNSTGGRATDDHTENTDTIPEHRSTSGVPEHPSNGTPLNERCSRLWSWGSSGRINNQPSVYIKKVEDTMIMMCCHVDDLLVVGGRHLVTQVFEECRNKLTSLTLK